MKITFNGTEFTEIEYIYPGETESQPGLLIHELDDVNRDGDMIIGNGCNLPKTADDAASILFNETGETSFHLENGVYILD